MSTTDLAVLQSGSAPEVQAPDRSDAWRRAARQAMLLAWASLAWMSVEGFVGLFAGLQAHSLGVITWSASSFLEAFAALIVVWRFTGRRTLSATSEARAQRWVAVSFLALAPFISVEAIRKLINGGETKITVLAVAVTISAIVLMPLLGWVKLRLGRRLDSRATSREGIQNLMCAVQAATATIALAGAGIGLSWLDPVAALAIAGIALKEGRDGRRGEDACCAPMPGPEAAHASGEDRCA